MSARCSEVDPELLQSKQCEYLPVGESGLRLGLGLGRGLRTRLWLCTFGVIWLRKACLLLLRLLLVWTQS